MARGGQRDGAGRTKVAIVTAVRLDIRCPYCDTGHLNDALAVKGQRLTCSDCGRDSIIPKSANIRVSNEDYPKLVLGSIKQGSLFVEPVPESVIEKTEKIKESVIEKKKTIKLDWELARKVLKEHYSPIIIRKMRRNQYNYHPDRVYLGKELRTKADLIEMAERIVSKNPDDYQRIIYKAILKGL